MEFGSIGIYGGLYEFKVRFVGLSSLTKLFVSFNHIRRNNA